MLFVVLVMDLGPLQKQYVFSTTEPTLQPPASDSYCTRDMETKHLTPPEWRQLVYVPGRVEMVKILVVGLFGKLDEVISKCQTSLILFYYRLDLLRVICV